MSKEKKKITKQKVFVDQWLSDPQLKEWLHKDKNDSTIARCFVCPAKISLSTAGRSALIEHGKGKKHSEALARRNQFFQKKSEVKSSAAASSNSNAENDESSIDLTSGGRQMTLKNSAGNCEKIKAEIIWTLKCVTSGFSDRSCDGLSDIFSAMFPDSEIAKDFKLGRLKATYLASYGIAPLFKSLLSSLVEKSDILVLSFDESLNEITQSCEMDIILRFWDMMENQVKIRYWDSAFFGHAKHDDLLKQFQNATKDLDHKKLYQISMDGPKVNFKFYLSQTYRHRELQSTHRSW